MKMLNPPVLSANWHQIDPSLKNETDQQRTPANFLNSEILTLRNAANNNPLLSMSLFGASVAFCFIVWMQIASPYSTMFDFSGEKSFSLVVIDLVFIAGLIGCLVAALWLFWAALVRAKPSVTVLNRLSRKVYGSYNAIPVEMDWNRVTPIITQGVLLAGGMKTLYNLMLVQFEEGKEPHRKTAERGIIISTGHISMGECAARWEYLRTYMEEAPDKLPETTIAPNDGWVGKVLEESLYGELHDTTQLVPQLRERQGVPVFNHWMSLFIFFFGPAMLFNLYQTFLQRQTKLPDAWRPTPSNEPNPYKVITPDANDLTLRSKAARYVALWLALCIGGGCAVWAWIVYLIAR